MPTPRTPTRLRELHGLTEGRQAVRGSPTLNADPPSWLSKAARDEWRRAVRALACHPEWLSADRPGRPHGLCRRLGHVPGGGEGSGEARATRAGPLERRRGSRRRRAGERTRPCRSSGMPRPRCGRSVRSSASRRTAAAASTSAGVPAATRARTSSTLGGSSRDRLRRRRPGRGGRSAGPHAGQRRREGPHRTSPRGRSAHTPIVHSELPRVWLSPRSRGRPDSLREAATS